MSCSGENDQDFNKRDIFEFVPDKLHKFDQNDANSFQSNKHVKNCLEKFDYDMFEFKPKSDVNILHYPMNDKNKKFDLWQMLFYRKTRLSEEIAFFTRYLTECEENEEPLLPKYCRNDDLSDGS